MALEKSTVSINLGNGIDQKSDDKIGPDNSFSYSRDLVFEKIGKINKRFGTDKLSNSSYYPLSNPLTIGTTPIPNNSIGFKDQVLLQNKGILYSRYGNDDKWYFKGHHYPVTVDKDVIHSNKSSSTRPDALTVNGITAYTYIEDKLSTGTSILKLTVIEEETGNYILNNVTVSDPSAIIYNPRVLKFSDRMFITWQTGNNILIANVPFAITTAISISTIQTDAATPAAVSLELDTEGIIDWVYTNKVGVGERNIGAYYTNGGNIKVFSVTNIGAVDATMGSNSQTATVIRGMSIYHNTVADVIYVGYTTPITTTPPSNSVTVKTYTFISSAITFGTTLTVSSPTPYRQNHIGMTYDPANTSNTVMFWDNYNSTTSFNINGNPVSSSVVVESIVYKATVSSSAVVSAQSLVMQGVGISARPISDVSRLTIYLPVNSVTSLQATNFILDIYRGRSDAQPNVLAKFNYGIANGDTSFGLPHFELLNDANFYFPITLKIAIEGEILTGLLFRTGISRATINFNPTYSASNVTLNNAAYMSGGYIGYYDGADYYDHSFMLAPEPVAVSTTVTAVMSLVVNQQGTASLPEITTFTFLVGGNLMNIGPTTYWTFSTPSTTFVVWYRINGNGVVPAIAGTKIQVDLAGNETIIQVVETTRLAILTATNTITIPKTNGSTFTITNVTNGVSTDATINMTVSAPGLIGAGQYQYTAIFYYIDVNGQIMRSAPAPATTISLINNSVTSIVVWSPPITNKDIVQVNVQLYRTLANGTIFHRVFTSISADKSWIQTAQQVAFFDNSPDAFISSNEILYTDGGILPNFGVGATRHLSLFKNRIVATDEDDNSIFYSKTAIQGSPIEFSEELSVDLSDDSDNISGHIQLDDKLIVGKEEKLYYLAGDGANDTGEASSFTLPTLIAADIGTTNNNSMVIYPGGVILKSNKGIYLLDRSLQVGYIGKEVEDFNSFTLSKSVLLKDHNQIRFELQDTTTCLMYDYFFRKWQVFSQYNGTDATMWSGQYARVDYDGSVYVENTSSWIDEDSAVETYNPVMTSKWLQIKNVQDFQRVYKLAILGDLKSAHTLRYRLYYDYDETNYDEYNFNSDQIYGNQYDDTVYQPIIHLKRQKCDAIKIEMTIIANGGSEQCLELVDMSFIVGVKTGLQKVRARKML